MKIRMTTLAGILVLLAVVGVLGAWSGLVPLSAREGHWQITRWFLHTTMRRTVKVRSSLITPPALDEPALVMRGAGHFESGCKPCHGAPGIPRPVTLRNMTPRPPFLPERVAEWGPEELFWIVRNGIKFTGMPGWPAPEREDEIWAMVAFLRKLDGMSAGEYRRLALGEEVRLALGEQITLADLPTEDPPFEDLRSCVRCHGLHGRGRLSGAFPKLAGQTEAYLLASLEAYADGRRTSGIMEPVAAALTDEAKLRVARYYSEKEALGTPGDIDEGARTRGEKIAREGIPSLKVPSCSDCHGPGAAERRAIYPRLAGQDAPYLLLQLQLFKSGERGGTAYAHLMNPVTERLPAEAMRDVAAYYAAIGR